MRGHAALAVAMIGAGLALPPRAAAQSFDGTYVGVLACESIPGTTQRSLSSAITIKVTGVTATYERVVQTSTGQPSGNVERGSGSVSPTGAIRLGGSALVGRVDMAASYTGMISNRMARLTGTQNWSKSGERKCRIDARSGG
jgi:hypothetical protein